MGKPKKEENPIFFRSEGEILLYMRLPERVAGVRFPAMMEDFDDAVTEEESSSSGSKAVLIAVVMGIIGIVVGATGIFLANQAQSEVRSLEARMASKPDKTVDIQNKVDEMDERLVKLGGEFVKLGRADRQIQENAQKAFTDVGKNISENRAAVNDLTSKMAELVDKLENWNPTVSVASRPIATSDEESGDSEPASQTGTLTEEGIYTIQSGDTFSKIAQKMGVSLSQLMAANPSANPNALQIGQKIVIPSR